MSQQLRRHSSEYSLSEPVSTSNKIPVDEENKRQARWHLYKLLLTDWMAILGMVPSLALGALPCVLVYLCTSLCNAIIFWMMSGFYLDPMHVVSTQCWKMAIVGAVLGVMKFLETFLWIRVGSRISIRIRKDLFRNMMRSEVSFFDTNPIGGILTLLSEDAQTVQEAFGEKKSIQIVAIGQAITGIVWAFCVSWQITLISLASAPVVIVILVSIIPAILKNSTLKFKHVSQSMTIAEETLSAIRTVRGFNREQMETNRFVKETYLSAKHDQKIGLWITLMTTLILITVSGDILANLYYGVWRVSKGWLEFGDMFSVFGYTILGSIAIIALQGTTQVEQKAIAAGARIMKLTDHVPAIPFQGGDIIEDFKGHIQFCNVSFKYPTRDVYVLKNVSFEIKPGQMGALVGHSGSGKSTCVQLLERYYDTEDGIIKLDGRDIRSLDPRWLHKVISLVSQEPVLFRMSLRENLRYGAPDATDEQLRAALQTANATKIVDRLEHGLDELVGEKGSSLSGGQRQRIAIARAVVKKPVILITDEATSALDAGSEKKVQMALDKIMQNCTSVIVAHRLSTIRNAHIIYVFDSGEIREVGTHEELVDLGGYYYNLVSRQLTVEDQERKNKYDQQKRLEQSPAINFPEELEKHETDQFQAPIYPKPENQKDDDDESDEESFSSSSTSEKSSN